MTTQTLPAKIDAKTPAGSLNNLRSFLEANRGQIALAVPKHLTPDRMVRVALTAFNRTPQLQRCTLLSILGGVIQASELGLELSGPLGQAYLVPRWNKKIGATEATFQVGYRGYLDLAMRSGRVDSIPLRIVYSNDLFDYAYGTKQYIRHVPSDDGPPPIKDVTLPYPDNVRAVYCVLNLKGTSRPDFEVMTTQQVEAHRARYSPDSYKGDFSPWMTSWEAMAMKTPCRKLAKRMPVSVEFQKAAMLEEYAEAGISQALTLDLGDAPQAELPKSRADEVREKLAANGTAKQQEVGTDPEEPAGEPERPALSEQEEMDIGNFVDDIGEQLKTADRLGDVDTVRAKVDEAKWLPEAYRKTLLDRCEARGKELAAPPSAEPTKRPRRTV